MMNIIIIIIFFLLILLFVIVNTNRTLFCKILLHSNSLFLRLLLFLLILELISANNIDQLLRWRELLYIRTRLNQVISIQPLKLWLSWCPEIFYIIIYYVYLFITLFLLLLILRVIYRRWSYEESLLQVFVTIRLVKFWSIYMTCLHY